MAGGFMALDTCVEELENKQELREKSELYQATSVFLVVRLVPSSDEKTVENEPMFIAV